MTAVSPNTVNTPTRPAIVSNAPLIPSSKLPAVLSKLITKSLLTKEVVIFSHATVILFKEASIPSKYTPACAAVAPAER